MGSFCRGSFDERREDVEFQCCVATNHVLVDVSGKLNTHKNQILCTVV